MQWVEILYVCIYNQIWNAFFDTVVNLKLHQNDTAAFIAI